jgi:predicted Zn-dependent protease
MKTINFVFLIIATLYSCKQVTTSSSSTPTYAANSSCSIGKWTALPTSGIDLKISSEFANDFLASEAVNNLNPVEQMADAWNQAITGKTFFVTPFATAASTGYTDLTSFRDGEMGIYKSHTWFSGVSSGALAITQYYGVLRSHSTLGTYIELSHADIILNYRDYQSNFTNRLTDRTGYDVATVVLHEMGHFLGMCHDSTHSSIMQPYYGSTHRSLYNFDKTKLNDLYVNNINTLGSNTSTNLSLPTGTEVRGTIELMNDGKCKHFLNGKLIFEHETEIKKGPVKNKAFYKYLSYLKK